MTEKEMVRENRRLQAQLDALNASEGLDREALDQAYGVFVATWPEAKDVRACVAATVSAYLRAAPAPAGQVARESLDNDHLPPLEEIGFMEPAADPAPSDVRELAKRLASVCERFIVRLGPSGYYPTAGMSLTQEMRGVVDEARKAGLLDTADGRGE